MHADGSSRTQHKRPDVPPLVELVRHDRWVRIVQDPPAALDRNGHGDRSEDVHALDMRLLPFDLDQQRPIGSAERLELLCAADRVERRFVQRQLVGRPPRRRQRLVNTCEMNPGTRRHEYGDVLRLRLRRDDPRPPAVQLRRVRLPAPGRWDAEPRVYPGLDRLGQGVPERHQPRARRQAEHRNMVNRRRQHHRPEELLHAGLDSALSLGPGRIRFTSCEVMEIQSQAADLATRSQRGLDLAVVDRRDLPRDRRLEHDHVGRGRLDASTPAQPRAGYGVDLADPLTSLPSQPREERVIDPAQATENPDCLVRDLGATVFEVEGRNDPLTIRPEVQEPAQLLLIEQIGKQHRELFERKHGQRKIYHVRVSLGYNTCMLEDDRYEFHAQDGDFHYEVKVHDPDVGNKSSAYLHVVQHMIAEARLSDMEKDAELSPEEFCAGVITALVEAWDEARGDGGEGAVPLLETLEDGYRMWEVLKVTMTVVSDKKYTITHNGVPLSVWSWHIHLEDLSLWVNEQNSKASRYHAAEIAMYEHHTKAIEDAVFSNLLKVCGQGLRFRNRTVLCP